MFLERFHTPGLAQVAYIIAAPESQHAADEPIAVVCGSGYRSCVGASILHRAGMQGVVTIPGNMEAWTAAGLPMGQEWGRASYGVMIV